MGVPLFLTWLRRRFADCFSTADEFKEKIDCLYIDLNALLYQSATVVTSEKAPSPRPPLREVEDAVLQALVEMLDDIIFTLVKPNTLVYLAVDGISPLGKMEQQRMRRRRGGMRASKLKDMWGWDSNCISVGTPFMSRVTDLLHFYAASRAERVNCERWKKLKENGVKVAAGAPHSTPPLPPPSVKDAVSNEVESSDETKPDEVPTNGDTQPASDSSSPAARDQAAEGHDRNEVSEAEDAATSTCNDDDKKEEQVPPVEKSADAECVEEPPSSSPAIHPMCIIVDDVTRPGEGENKILDAIRRFRAQPNYDHNTTYAICSSDTDVIVCSLILHEPRIHVLRYEPPASMTMPKKQPGWDRGAGNVPPIAIQPMRPDGAPISVGGSIPITVGGTIIHSSPPLPTHGKSLLAPPTLNQPQRTQRPAIHRQLSRNTPQQRDQQNRSFIAAKTANAARRSLLAPPPVAASPQAQGPSHPMGNGRSFPMHNQQQQHRAQRPGPMHNRKQPPHAMMATAHRMGRGRGSGAAYLPNRMLGGRMFPRPMRQGQTMMGQPAMFSGGRGFGPGAGGRGSGPGFGGLPPRPFQPRPQEAHVPKFFNMEKFLAHMYKVLGSPDGKLAFARSLHDVVFTLLLFGNDFLPSVGGTIEDGGTLDRLLDVLAKEFISQNRPIVNPHTNQIDFEAATHFVSQLHKIKKGQLLYQANNPTPRPPPKTARKENLDSQEKDRKPAEGATKSKEEAPLEAEKPSNSVEENATATEPPATVEQNEAKGDEATEPASAKPANVNVSSEKRTRSSTSNGMPPHHRRSNVEQRACLKAHAYWTMLQWALLYCVGQVPHWRCYYPYSTPPPLLSLTKYSGTLPCSALSPYSTHYLGKESSVEDVKAKIARDTASKPSSSSSAKNDGEKSAVSSFFQQEVSHPVDVMVQLLFLLPGTSKDLLPMVMSRNYSEIDAFVQQPVDKIDIPRISDWCTRKSLRMTDNERLRCDGYRFFSKTVAGKPGMDTAFAAYWRQEALDPNNLQGSSSVSSDEDWNAMHESPMWAQVFEKATKAASYFAHPITPSSVKAPAAASPLAAALALLARAVQNEENGDKECEQKRNSTTIKEEAAEMEDSKYSPPPAADSKLFSPPSGSELFGDRSFSILMAPMTAMQDSRMVQSAGCLEGSHFHCGKYYEPLHLGKGSKDVLLQWRLVLKPDAPEDFFPKHVPELPDPKILQVVKTGEAADETAVAPKTRKRTRGEEENEAKSASSGEDSEDDDKGSWGSDSMYSYSDYDSNGDGLSHPDSETDTAASKPQGEEVHQVAAGPAPTTSTPNSEPNPGTDDAA